MTKTKALIDQIKTKYDAMLPDLEASATNKAAARRARKLTLDLEKLFKEYRKVSCEEARK